MRHIISKVNAVKIIKISAVATLISLSSAIAAAELNSPELTPFGAERAADPAEGIPEWTGGLEKKPINQSGGKFHTNPFSDEKPIAVIDRANMASYEQYLSEGVKALYKSYGTYSINLYPTHRTMSAPEEVYQNTKLNTTRAKLVKDGNGIEGAIGGIPFPIPKSGIELFWNHIARWQGVYYEDTSGTAIVDVSGKFSLLREQNKVLVNYYNKNNPADLDNVLIYFVNKMLPPSRSAGEILLVHETVDQVKEPRRAWAYFAGQRRVRRAPTLAYDTPQDGYFSDEADMLNGAPDRYDWKIVGKAVKIIPYNSYELASESLKYEDILKPGHINPEHARWEKHRVWVLEANLKQGQRHIYSKRRFYIDEDSWAVVMSENYDGRGELWRVNIAHTLISYEVPTISPQLTVYHDLTNRTYTALGLKNQEKIPRDFSAAIPDEKFWTPGNLRRMGVQ
ncbi:DUF1329 domain-containing protein [Pseudomonas peli]|nr:DUF1329 domain-containing protein [Pseudomonas peli]NMZ70544.1 DUF1329 domain-containing protein [Pseudomonas peli]